MGWEGIHLFQFHLRAIRYGSWEISARSPEVTLESLRLRRGAPRTFAYVRVSMAGQTTALNVWTLPLIFLLTFFPFVA